MTIQYWRVFVTVCKYNSITKAAQALQVAQPSVSRTIKEIETYYNIKLFDRINKRLYITEVGEEVFYRACEAIRAFDSLEDYICGGHHMSVGASVMIGNYIVQDSIEEYRRIAPNSNIELLIDLSKIIAQHIIAGELDFAFTERLLPYEEVDQICFPGDPVVIICRKDHPLAQSKTVHLTQLTEHKLYLKQKGSVSRDLLDKELEKNHLKITPAFESDSTNTILDRVISDGEVAVLPFLQTRNRCAREHLVRLYFKDVELRRSYYLVRPKNKYLSNSAQTFIDICMSKAKEVNQDMNQT